MGEGKVMKCPKCDGEIIEADRLVAHTRVLAKVSLAKKGDLLGDEITPYYCSKCGYIEFYKEPKPGEKLYSHSFLRNCVKCSKSIPIASEECPYCETVQEEGVKH